MQPFAQVPSNFHWQQLAFVVARHIARHNLEVDCISQRGISLGVSSYASPPIGHVWIEGCRKNS